MAANFFLISVIIYSTGIGCYHLQYTAGAVAQHRPYVAYRTQTAQTLCCRRVKHTTCRTAARQQSEQLRLRQNRGNTFWSHRERTERTPWTVHASDGMQPYMQFLITNRLQFYLISIFLPPACARHKIDMVWRCGLDKIMVLHFCESERLLFKLILLSLHHLRMLVVAGLYCNKFPSQDRVVLLWLGRVPRATDEQQDKRLG